MIRYSFSILLILALVNASSCQQDKEKVKIFISWPGSKSLPHYSWNYSDSKPTGVEPRLIEKVLKIANIDFEYVRNYQPRNKKGDPRIDVLKENYADISIRGISITKSRKKDVLFSKPYYVDGLGIMIRKSDNISNLKDLTNKVIFAHSYTTAYNYVQEKLKHSKLVTYETGKYITPENLLKEKKIDAYIIDITILKQIEKSNPELKVLPMKLTKEQLAIAVSKNRKDLLKKINNAIIQIEEKGGLDDLCTDFEK